MKLNLKWINMRQTEENIIEFYKQLYTKNSQVNPAYKIYDKLRIQGVKKFIVDLESTMLIVGCGNRNDIEFLTISKKTYAFDLSFQAVQRINYQKNVFTADALAIPFNNGIFDIVICSEVLEHIPDIDLALEEFYRVLKQDGTLIISTPNWWSLFGLSRWLGEFFTKRMISSDNQPYDDWKTIIKLNKELKPYFSIESILGVWYLPPLHFRGRGLSEKITNLINFFYTPFEKLFSKLLPIFGHLIILKCSRNSSKIE